MTIELLYSKTGISQTNPVTIYCIQSKSKLQERLKPSSKQPESFKSLF